MSPKKTILKTLKEQEADGSHARSVRPATIPGFADAPEKYQQTINALLKDRLIEGMKDDEGHMTISLNSHRARDVQRVLRPIWAHPALLAVLALSLLGMATILAI